MKTIFRLSVLIFISINLINCVSFKRKASTKVKKALRANGGNWEVNLTDYYFINNGTQYIGEQDYGYIGDYHFSKDEGGSVASTEAGTWSPQNGSTENILYQVFTNDNDNVTVTVAIYKMVNGSWTSDGGSIVQEDYDKKDMIWESKESSNDTIITHTYFLRNKG